MVRFSWSQKVSHAGSWSHIVLGIIVNAHGWNQTLYQSMDVRMLGTASSSGSCRPQSTVHQLLVQNRESRQEVLHIQLMLLSAVTTEQSNS